MKILVTGGSGHIGRYVVQDLVEAGHKVTNGDLVPPAERRCFYLRVDLTDAGQVYQALLKAAADAVIHLGAWPNAGIVPDTRTYGENVQSTFNTFQACAELGIKRVIFASSAQVYGLARLPPLYLPVDEDHPLRPLNCYALSKMAGEQAAYYFISNGDLSILSFRFMGVRSPARLESEMDQMVRDPASGTRLMWTRTDARDAALACRLAVEQEEVPSGPYNITGARVVLAETTIELVQRYYDKPIAFRGPLTGHNAPMSCARAEAAFGYRPNFLWSETQRYPETD